ncbi:hypothetical protein ASD54_04685 [Rhizobium sp. Root149]|uniref:phage tail protein n=1 Tax=Rhizobium sp. Root149 TaxID=1736473 RepID=UPI00071272EB|nr:phage tail protein [Rhizobium sp. Root149]KQZ54627.1 hypothetical protein ASD54_04685 [Rhizobium sp. Root149]
MAGTVNMTLGDFAFEGLGFGYEAVSRRLDTKWAEIQLAQGMNVLQHTGGTSDELTIRGVLFPVEFGGQGSLEGIMNAALAGTPLMLVSGSEAQGVVHGLYVVQSVEQDRTHHTIAGVPRKNAYSIQLRRYGSSLSGAGLASALAGAAASALASIL